MLFTFNKEFGLFNITNGHGIAVKPPVDTDDAHHVDNKIIYKDMNSILYAIAAILQCQLYVVHDDQFTIKGKRISFTDDPSLYKDCVPIIP
jgi:hypothetical protein